MATCNQCIYWELSIDGVNGNCYHPNRPGRPLYGPTGHCLNFEQKGVLMVTYCGYSEKKGTSMGTCKECKHWEPFTASWNKINEKGGWCRNINVVDKTLNLLPHSYNGEKEEIATHFTFGCVHFEQKSEGPFKPACHDLSPDDNWDIGSNHEYTGVKLTWSEAKTICDWLNEHWRE